ncbi:nuclear transport factor 2 family protein [Actinomyces bowdenii]|uniref:nuclear transport factor 2 family protein n=1 Tax=Actinomyces bowdenii TaxID=131109 RepID=UPI001ABCE6A8|nr:nuclear transport factor 2 family protein [Actinomyces bowdenii]MBO3725605.1 nuclear transport factor 2 family protein [Actinomyces bowdenii]
MNESHPIAVAEEYFSALGQGRVEDALALLAEDIVWHQPGGSRYSGRHEGRRGVGELIGAMAGASGGTLRVAATGPAMANGDLVAVPVRFTATRPGSTLDQGGIDLLTIREGRIVEVHLFSQDGPAEDLFWGRD